MSAKRYALEEDDQDDREGSIGDPVGLKGFSSNSSPSSSRSRIRLDQDGDQMEGRSWSPETFRSRLPSSYSTSDPTRRTDEYGESGRQVGGPSSSGMTRGTIRRRMEEDGEDDEREFFIPELDGIGGGELGVGQQRSSSSENQHNLIGTTEEGTGGQGWRRRRRRRTPLEEMMVHWSNQRGSPEILPFPTQSFDDLVNQIEQQQSILDNLGDQSDEDEHLRLNLVRLDLERSKWLLTNFLRSRLVKIEAFHSHILGEGVGNQDGDGELEKLTDLEIGYVKRYNELRSNHFKTTVLDFLPENMRGLEDTSLGTSGGGGRGDMVVRPDLEAPVFIRCVMDCGPLTLIDGETTNLTEGSIHLLRYRNVRRLVYQGRVELL